MSRRSLFITFEGPEGGGKTTQIELLERHLERIGLDVLVTRQPGGNAVGRELRKIMLDIGRENVCARAELLMMMADRIQSVETVILPHLKKEGTVICDRYGDSSVAYQAGGRGLDKGWVVTLNDFATTGLMPDITFLLDIDPKIGIARQIDRNKMELMDAAFHDRVRAAYLELAEQFPERIKVVDAECSVALVHERIVKELEMGFQIK